MTTFDFEYQRRLEETLSALGGGRVTLSEAMAHQPPSAVAASQSEGMFGGTMTASEIAQIGRLSGTHEVRQTMRGRGWNPQPRPHAPDGAGYRFAPAEPGAERVVYQWTPEQLQRMGIEIVE
jgi:hypothetical protein